MTPGRPGPPRPGRSGRGGPPPKRRGRPAPRDDAASDRRPAGDRFAPPSRDPIVALLEKQGRFLTATSFFTRGRRLNVDRHARARAGDLVVVVPTTPRGHNGRIVRVIGKPDVARDVLEAFMLERGLRRRFDPLVDNAARDAAADPPHARRDQRTDLRELPTFTIDPPTARDFDDAISAQHLPAEGITRVWVHIADVSAHVVPGSPVDREAMRRATSVYVPGAVEPMLPEALSNNACSLVPGEDRLAVTVEIDFRGAGRVRTAFYRSIIRSDQRLTYPQVDEIFAGTEQAEEPWAAPLAAARTVAAALDARRHEHRGALEILSGEPDFELDPRGHVTGQRQEPQTESHRLVEHLMIAANEAVATLLETQRKPTLYRVHERPDPARIEHLVEQLASLDVPTPPLPESMTPQQAADLAGETSRMVAAHVERTGRGRIALTSLVLRTLKRAEYTPVNRGHAGLASPRYTHFTSPIRRYPDLVSHRALLAAVGAGEEPPAASELERLGAWCSERERAAMAVERGADRIARCFWLERELFENGFEQEFDGEISGLVGAGAFVTFGDGHEGMLPVRSLRGDWWELNELETMLVGAESGRTMALGDPVRVRVERVDAPRGRVDLRPVQL